MPFSIPHAPVTPGVRAAWQAHSQKSDSWNLLLDKLSFQPGSSVPDDRRESPKHNALVKICESYAAAKPALDRITQRQSQFLTCLSFQHGPRIRSVWMVNSTRLLLHLGRASSLENIGLYCDRTTGLPIIPGSAVKGLVSTWACWEGNLLPDGALPESISTEKQNRARFSNLAERIFGSNSETGSTAAGEVVFLGGFPLAPPKMELDILTPHEGGNPLPNPFLALDPGTRWIFPLLARAGCHDVDSLLKQAADWLGEALTQVGLGAKTAAGYGRFRFLTAAESTRLEVERQAIIAAVAEKRNEAKREQDRLAIEVAKQAKDQAIAKQKAEKLAQLSPEERAYAVFVDKVTDWIALAREIAMQQEVDKQHILRYFRTPEGQALLKTWTNDKGKKRIQNLKGAGL